MTESLETITASIYLGLREGYSKNVHSIQEVKDFLQEYVNKGGLCVSLTPTTFFYKGGSEEGVVIGLINYPRYPFTKEKLKQVTEDLAMSCKEKFKQIRMSIVYQDQTVMLE
ncbi:MAG: hypothetical protein V1660_00170 [archaeon]